MTSILTNAGAMVALNSLQNTQNMLNDTQNQISTGLAVSTAKDNAAVWTVATTMKANVASLNQTATDLGNASSILGTAVTAANTIESLVSQIRAQVTSLSDTATNTSATAANISQLALQISSTITSAAFNGVNLLNATQSGGLTFEASTANNYVSSVSNTSATISTGAITDLSSGGTTGTAFLTAFVTGLSGLTAPLTDAQVQTDLTAVDTYSTAVEASASQLGAVQASVNEQQSFVTNLATTFQTGAGAMVDANMAAESAKLTALQTQQSLGISALSIANQAPQAILKLFQ
jgi:flagellin